MVLLDVVLFVLIEGLLPHVLAWKDEGTKIFQVKFLSKGNPKWDITYISLFKIMDSFNKSKYEEYSNDANYETSCKRRFGANIQKSVLKKELVCRPEEKDGSKRVLVYEINLSDEEITQRISNLSELEKVKIRQMVAEDYRNREKGTKRYLQDPSPSTSSSKKFKPNASIEDLPSTSAQVLPVTSSSIEQDKSSTVINYNITYNIIIPVEAIHDPLFYQFLNQFSNNEVSTPALQIETNGHPPEDRIQDSSSPYLNEVLPLTSNENEPSSGEQIPVSSYSYTENNALALTSNLNEESFVPQTEEFRPLGNYDLGVNNNDPVVGIPEEKSEFITLLDEFLKDAQDWDSVDNKEEDNFGRSIQDQGLEERPTENQEHGVINNGHLSFPNLENHEMVLGNVGVTEPSFNFNGFTEVNNNHCGRF